MKKAFSVLILLSINLIVSGQNNTGTTNTGPALSKAFENPDPEIELQRLQSKRYNLVVRLNELKSAEQPDPVEINRIEGLIKYLDAKIESIEKYLASVKYAEEQGMPVQGNLSDEEYQAKLLEWKKQRSEDTNKQEGEIKTTLTREEFNRLPKERQERILGMPERYTIID